MAGETKTGKVDLEIRFTCGTHSQKKECGMFEQDEKCPSTKCKYGIPDCDCQSDQAQWEAVVKFYEAMKGRVKNVFEYQGAQRSEGI